eukprot:143354_1
MSSPCVMFPAYIIYLSIVMMYLCHLPTGSHRSHHSTELAVGSIVIVNQIKDALEEAEANTEFIVKHTHTRVYESCFDMNGALYHDLTQNKRLKRAKSSYTISHHNTNSRSRNQTIQTTYPPNGPSYRIWDDMG